MNKTKILSRKGTSLKLQYPTSHKFEGGGDILSAGLRVAGAGIEGGLANSAIKDTASLDDTQAALMSLDTDVNSMDDLWNIRKNLKYASTNNARGDFMKDSGYYWKNGAKAALSGAAAGAQLGSIVPGIGNALGTIGGFLVGTVGSLIGGGIAGNKARRTAERENRESLYANNYALASLNNSGNNIADNNMFDYNSHYAALGGKLNKDYPIGLTFINAGGTHEENPNEGVPAGIAPDGKPNLVEQGEVIYNDYVFSNRFPIPDDILEMVGLPSKYRNNTPARIAERESTEIAERPNDIISKNNLDISLGKLTLAQELTKQRSDEANQQAQNSAVMAALGGRVHKLARGSDLEDSKISLDALKEFFTKRFSKSATGDLIFGYDGQPLDEEHSMGVSEDSSAGHLLGALRSGASIDNLGGMMSSSRAANGFLNYLAQKYGIGPDSTTSDIAKILNKISDTNLANDYFDYALANYGEEGLNDLYRQYVNLDNQDAANELYEEYKKNGGKADYFSEEFENYFKEKNPELYNQMNQFEALHTAEASPEELPRDIAEQSRNPLDSLEENIMSTNRRTNRKLARQASREIRKLERSEREGIKEQALAALDSMLPEIDNPFIIQDAPFNVGDYINIEEESPLNEPDYSRLYREALSRGTQSPASSTGQTSTKPGANQGNPEEDTSSEKDKKEKEEKRPLPTWMRFAPVANSIWQVLEDTAGITNVPDYTEANSIRDAYNKIEDVSFRPVNTYVRNTPINRGFYLNTLGQNAAATRSAIKAQSGLNRGTAIGSLAAADYTANMGIGNLMRNLEDMDFERGLKTAEFNRGTESLNSQGLLSAGNANMQADVNRARGYNLAATVAAQERQRVDANRTTNRNVLATNFGLVGRENALRNMSDNPAFLYQLMKDFNIGYKNETARGGKLNRRKHHA